MLGYLVVQTQTLKHTHKHRNYITHTYEEQHRPSPHNHIQTLKRTHTSLHRNAVAGMYTHTHNVHFCVYNSLCLCVSFDTEQNRSALPNTKHETENSLSANTIPLHIHNHRCCFFVVIVASTLFFGIVLLA